jgi:hypothetical protein
MRIAIGFLSAVVVLNCSLTSHAGLYSISRVYTGWAYDGVAINDNGLVALSDYRVMITDGRTTTILATLLPNPSAHCLSINNSGFVAFRVTNAQNNYCSLLVSDGTTTRTLASDNTGSNGSYFYLSNTTTLSINDNGTVPFEAVTSTGWSLYTADGIGPVRTVRAGGSQSPAINNAGTIVCRDADTSAVEIVKGSSRYTLATACPWAAPDINDLDVAAVVSGQHQITVGNGIDPPTYIDGSKYAALGSKTWIDFGYPSLAINNQGVVVFGAFTDRVDGTYGMFTGPDPIADKVIQEGDTLLGATITDLSFSRGGFNNRGQIAFNATLSDGTSGVFVATPIPEPSTVALLAAAGLGLLACGGWRRKRRAWWSGNGDEASASRPS